MPSFVHCLNRALAPPPAVSITLSVCIFWFPWAHSFTISATIAHTRDVRIINRNQNPVTAVFAEKYTWLVLTWLASQAAADLVICSAMVLLLRARRTGFKKCVDTVFLLRTLLSSLG